MRRDLARGTPRPPGPSAPIRPCIGRCRVIPIPVPTPVINELVRSELTDAWDRGACRDTRGLGDAATETEERGPTEAAATAGEDGPDHEERCDDDQRDLRMHATSWTK